MREKLLNEMEKLGINANQLAYLSCVPQPTIHRFLSGVHGEPSGSTVRKLAKGLGISEAELRGIDNAIATDEATLLSGFRALTPGKQQVVLDVVKALIGQG